MTVVFVLLSFVGENVRVWTEQEKQFDIVWGDGEAPGNVGEFEAEDFQFVQGPLEHQEGHQHTESHKDTSRSVHFSEVFFAHAILALAIPNLKNKVDDDCKIPGD